MQNLSQKKHYKPVILVVIDGFGLGEEKNGNAISEAKKPTIDKLNSSYPCIALQASGISVGLPWGEPGNSEVGHMTMGTGMVIYQSLPRITMAVQNGEFFKNEEFLQAVNHAKENNSNLHLLGLVGKGGIHSNIDHLYALLELAQKNQFDRVFLHIFTDGRDSSPTSAAESIKELQKKMESLKIGKIATLGGRYYGMDRNNNWDRIQKSYDTITKGEGEKTKNPIDYINKSYAKEIFDEYLTPAVITENEKPVATIRDNDSVIFFNYREDRARQITKAFVSPEFKEFKRQEISNLYFVMMVQYEEDLPAHVAFPPITVNTCLGEILSQNKLTQLRIAETEKFAHVTYFFNGGKEENYPGEDRVIVPSKNVSSFDKAPEMSAEEITDKLISFVEKEKYDFILVNYANADIVGHTGNEKAAISAIETIDICLGNLIKTVTSKDGCLLITADHGNAEEMINTHTGEADTEHSANPVPLWFVTKENNRKIPRETVLCKIAGLLSDLAPTILELFKIEKPKEMTGESLLDILE